MNKNILVVVAIIVVIVMIVINLSIKHNKPKQHIIEAGI
jgi:peptidoglycan hydrolase CwlO-like protein